MSKFDLVRTLGTLEEMLVDRKLDVSDFPSDREQLASDILAAPNQTHAFDARSCGVRVVYCMSSKYQGRDVKRLMGEPANGITHGILVTREPSTSQVLASDKPQIIKTHEEWPFLSLRINISRHSLQPRFELIDKEGVQEVLQTYKITKQQMPNIKPTDPMARYYGLKANDVVKVTYPTPSDGTTFKYVCVK